MKRAAEWRVDTARGVHYELIKTTGLFAPENDTLLRGGRSEPGSRRFVAVDESIL